ncbi:protein mono-ADP-ribosyltransferase PARP11-like [Myxocyprinus asiaticus]|uniref:protein mono-ADP-ribosyltransferase PARP11-like n=1 Tax=Myxocyprinus asiaticus TaxID=70543 RepID=UPI0022219585|nr:protein mono-ADP-ribosyltransferase PARP11-like [Myxocyprinus asiaticus]
MMLNALAGLELEDEVEYMDTSDTPWYWFYKADCGVWHRVEDEPKNSMSSAELERYYLKNPYGVIQIFTSGGQFKIDFAARTQVNLKTGQTRGIKRSYQTEYGFRCQCDDVFPSPPANWENVDPRQTYQIIPLRRETREYQQVERFVRNDGLLLEPIISINRIQNLDLWELFQRKKIQLMRIKGQSDIEEQRLFHGTSERNLHFICTYNFNCRLSDRRRRSHVYGKGTYFAKHASFATKYSEITSRGTKVMLLARVIVGKYKTGYQDYCKPDDDQDENLHDSCVDDTLYPRIFVIFDCNQIYPEYVLEYRNN